MRFVVGEYWSGPDDIGGWLDGVAQMTDSQIAAFDFPLRYKLRDVCDTPNYDLRNLTDGGSVSAARPFNGVTFTENHDMASTEVVNDKMLGYSFILTRDGYPCVFWWDLLPRLAFSDVQAFHTNGKLWPASAALFISSKAPTFRKTEEYYM